MKTVRMKRATVGSSNFESCSALLRMLLLCIGIYLKSVLRYKYLILSDDVKIRSYYFFFEAKKCPPTKSTRNTALEK